MKTRILILVILFSAVCVAFAAPAPEVKPAVRRFGLFIGANNGGSDRPALRYAVRDAESLSRLFSDMGGIRRQDNILLVEPSLKELLAKMKTIETRASGVRSQYSRLEFIFYYSGHSDEEGLLLSKDKFSYRDLKDFIKKMPADMRVVILDSCSSGALTKLKGGNKNPPFLMDSSVKTEGYAFLTSSSADEASQESESLKGSYFTYALLSGLRGAADTRGDGRVTLNQAYQYAYQETLLKTEKTFGGAQHPNYDMQMSGAGEIILTDLRETTASLKFATDLSGRLSIRDASGILIAEISKEEGKTVELGLEPGEYRVTAVKDKKVSEGNISLNEGDRAVFSKIYLKPVATELTSLRGDQTGSDFSPAPSPFPRSTESENGTGYVTIPFSFAIIPIISTMKTIVNFQLNIGAGYCDVLNGTSVGFVNITGESARSVNLSLVGFTGKNFDGYDGSLVSLTGKDFRGAQTTLVSFTGGNFDGFQSGFVNLVTGDFNAVQTGLVNFTGGNFDGFRAGLVNFTGGDFNGCDIGLVNFSVKSVAGPQVSLVNFAGKIRGFQLGLVNVAGEIDGVAIGLVSIVAKNGQLHGQAWIDETGFVNAALVHGSKTVYNIYHVGADVGFNLWTCGLGLGVHLPFDPCYVNIEIIGSSVSRFGSWNGNNTLSRLRAYFGFSFMEHLSLIGGISLNYLHSWNGTSADVNPVLYLGKTFDNGDKLWPGIFVGMMF